MPTNPVAENVLGTIGTICWTGQLLPQVWKSWRTKSTEGLSHWLVLIWCMGSFPMGVYAIIQNLNVPLIVQPQLFGFFSLISWGQCQFYGYNRPLRTCIIMCTIVGIVVGGLEAGMVFAIKPSYDNGNIAGARFFGILSSFMISIALFPQYYEIYKHKEVIGISMLFMTIDLSGGIFSDLSLVFKGNFDIIAGIMYSLVILLDGVVIVCAIILNPLAARRRRREAARLAAEAQAGEIVPDPVRDGSESRTLRFDSRQSPCPDEERGVHDQVDEKRADGRDRNQGGNVEERYRGEKGSRSREGSREVLDLDLEKGEEKRIDGEVERR